MKKSLKLILSVFLILAVGMGIPLFSFAEEAEEKPLMRIAMFSDLHVEFGLQDMKKPIRPSTVNALDYLIDDLTDGEGVDVFLVGGDMTGPRGGWTAADVVKTKNSIHEYLSAATDDGKVLYVMGNHDPEPSFTVGEQKTTEYSGDYIDLMTEGFGEPVSVLYSSQISSRLSPYDEPLCYRYTVKGIEFIGLNTPYLTNQAKASGLYPEQTEWLEEELAAIGKDKTVFLVCHYPVESIRTLKDPGSLSADNQCLRDMKRLLEEYTNIVYCFGHAHDGDTRWAKTRTSDLVKATGMYLVKAGIYKNKGYIDAHMGSMGYYANVYQPGGLTEEDPMIVQFLTVDLYEDRMVFQIHNTGEKYAVNGKKEVQPLSIARDIGVQMGVSKPVTDTSSDVKTDVTLSGSTADVAVGDSQSGDSSLTVILLCVLGAVVLGGAVAVILLFRKKPEKK